MTKQHWFLIFLAAITNSCRRTESVDYRFTHNDPVVEEVRLEHPDDLKSLFLAGTALTGGMDMRHLADCLGLGFDDELILKSSKMDAKGREYLRVAQLHKRIPVWGGDVVVVKSGEDIQLVSGNLLFGMAASPLSVDPNVSGDRAAEIAKNDQGDGVVTTNGYTSETKRLVVTSVGPSVFLAWHIEFSLREFPGTTPQRWSYLVEATKGFVLSKFNKLDTLTQASGPGGNEKATRQWTEFLDVEPRDNHYVMDTARLQTIDMGNQKSSGETVRGDLDQFLDPVANDAHGFAEATLDMLLNEFGYNSINDAGLKIVSRVHFDNDLENAFWDPSTNQLTLGDGGDNFYPMGGAIDVVAHEIGHGFTSFHSDLIYRGESGGVNESFSDILGTTAEWFLEPQRADFLIGEDIVKAAFGREAFRFMCNPTADGKSIDHASKYNSTLDVHFSSGVMNKAFCLAAKRFSSGGSVAEQATQAGVLRTAKVFLGANENFWPSNASFAQACQGTTDAAAFMGYAASEIGWLIDSWSDVGVNCSPVQFAVTPSKRIIVFDQKASATVTMEIRRQGNFSGPVVLTVQNLPVGISATWDLTSADSPKVTFAAGANAVNTDSEVKVVASSGVSQRIQRLALVVVKPVTLNSMTTGISAKKGEARYFKLPGLPASKSLLFDIDGNHLLTVFLSRHGAFPTLSSAACGGVVAGGNTQANCFVAGPNPGDWYLSLYNWYAADDLGFDHVTLRVTKDAPFAIQVGDALVEQGAKEEVKYTLLKAPGFSGSPVVSFQGLPAGAKAEVAANSTIRISANNAREGEYAVRAIAKVPGFQSVTTFLLDVTASKIYVFLSQPLKSVVGGGRIEGTFDTSGWKTSDSRPPLRLKVTPALKGVVNPMSVPAESKGNGRTFYSFSLQTPVVSKQTIHTLFGTIHRTRQTARFAVYPKPVAQWVEDSYVDPSSSKSVFGTVPILKVSPVSGFSKGPMALAKVSFAAVDLMASVKLSLYVKETTNSSEPAVKIQRVSCGWSEKTVNAETKIQILPAVIDSVSGAQPGQPMTFELKTALSKDGTYCFAIQSEEGATSFHSREAADAALRPSLRFDLRVSP